MLEALSVTKASGSPLDLARSGVRFGKKHAIIAEILHPKNPRKETKTNDYSTVPPETIAAKSLCKSMVGR